MLEWQWKTKWPILKKDAKQFVHIFNILLKKKLLQFTVHSYLRDYNPIDKEHLSFVTGMPTSQCKRKEKIMAKNRVRLMVKEIKRGKLP